MEKKIDDSEQKKKELETLSLTPEYAMDYVKAMEITSQIDELSKKLEALYSEWEELTSI